MQIYAGLDVDGKAKLFTIEAGKPVLIDHATWLKVIDELNGWELKRKRGRVLEPSEMPSVDLVRAALDWYEPWRGSKRG